MEPVWRFFLCSPVVVPPSAGDDPARGAILMGQAVGAALNKMNEEVGILAHHFEGYRCGWASVLQGDAGFVEAFADGVGLGEVLRLAGVIAQVDEYRDGAV